MGRVLSFYTPIHKVLEQPWRHFTSLKLCKCYQIPHPSVRVTSTPMKQKPTTTIDLSSTITPHTLNYTTSLAVGLTRSSQTPRATNPWTHLPFLFHLNNTRNKNVKPQVHPASLFRSVTPGTIRITHVPSIQG